MNEVIQETLEQTVAVPPTEVGEEVEVSFVQTAEEIGEVSAE